MTVTASAFHLDGASARTALLCAGLTVMMVAAAWVGVGNYHFYTLFVVAGWSSLATAAFMCFHGAFQLWRTQKIDLHRYPEIFLFVIIAGIHLGAFNPVKGWLNELGFWADPMLAAVDNLIFLGRDPWALLTWLANDIMAAVYSRAWFIVTLVCVPIAVYRRKYRLLLLYFLIWGPLALVPQALFQAGGPIFFDELGYGDRFLALPYPDQVEAYASYLWSTYANDQFGLGSGISALPSVHIMIATWLALLWWDTPMRWPILAFSFLLFLLSIAVGWHYAVDGIIGALLVLAGDRMLKQLPLNHSIPAREQHAAAA